MSFDSNSYRRQVYEIFEFFGDIGGVIEILMITSTFFVGSYANLKMQSYLSSELFKQKDASEVPEI